MVVLFDRARSFGRDAHGAVREEGDTRLASQISRINPGDQWGDRCRNQIALTCSKHLKESFSDTYLAWTELPLQGVGVRALVRELRSCMLCGIASPKIKIKVFLGFD